MPVRHFYLLSHYICYRLFFLFSVCWLHVNECNSLWRRERGRDQKSTACLEGIVSRILKKSPLYLSYILIQECLGILAARCASCNVWHTLIKTMYCDNIMINVSCTVIACSIILSSVKLEKSQHSGESIRISYDLLTSPPYPFQKLLHSFLLEPTNRK